MLNDIRDQNGHYGASRSCDSSRWQMWLLDAEGEGDRR
jgi:hypothetical protein